MSTSTDGLAAFQWDLADRLGKSLRVADMSAQDMADYLEVHRNTVGSWLNGRTTPNGAILKLWAMRTGAPYHWLRYGQQGKSGGPDGDGYPNPSDPDSPVQPSRQPSGGNEDAAWPAAA
jgi:transcriptional regulator with XRE-family HTH domain